MFSKDNFVMRTDKPATSLQKQKSWPTPSCQLQPGTLSFADTYGELLWDSITLNPDPWTQPTTEAIALTRLKAGQAVRKGKHLYTDARLSSPEVHSREWPMLTTQPTRYHSTPSLLLSRSECKWQWHLKVLYSMRTFFFSNFSSTLLATVWHTSQLTMMAPLVSTALDLFIIATSSNCDILPHCQKAPTLTLLNQKSTGSGSAVFSLSLGPTHRNWCHCSGEGPWHHSF
jgi:hypothetical protein